MFLLLILAAAIHTLLVEVIQVHSEIRVNTTIEKPVKTRR